MTHTQQSEHAPLPELAFFAAANTAEGFVNRFPALFGDGSGIGRLYVIKGGPGTGKSRFMREAAACAEAHGREVIYLYCSSDPSSLDGLLISGRGGTIGIIDGTAPHAWELSRPGVREELVDLGAFWDASRLSAQAGEIERLCRDKADAYTQAYRWLRACGEADRVLDSLTRPLCDPDAMRRRAERLLRGAMKRGVSGSDIPDARRMLSDRLSPCGQRLPPLFRRGFAMTGEARLGTMENCAEQVVCLPDRTGMAAVFAAQLLTASEKLGLPVLVTDNPLRPECPDGLLWPTLGLCVLCGESEAGCPVPAESVNLHRLADAEGLRRVRSEVRAAAALRDSLRDAALGSLARAREAHFALETIYTAAMDFAAKEAFSKDFCRRVFGA